MTRDKRVGGRVRSDRASSFFSERTAEYILVPQLQHSLACHFGTAIPIYFWKSREGNRTSLRIQEPSLVRVLAMFARRAKVSTRDNVVTGKINAELLSFALAADAMGIFTVAGFPAVRSLLELCTQPLTYWFRLTHSGLNDSSFVVDRSQNAPVPMDVSGTPLSWMTLPEVTGAVEGNTDVVAWGDAVDRLTELRMWCLKAGGRSKRSQFGGYNPVYFLIPSAKCVG